MNNYVDYYNYLNNLNQKKINNSTGMNIVNTNSNKTSYDSEPYLGFVRGNMFNNLYSPYMNYKPHEFNPSNEKEYLLLLVQMYGFAAHDLGLYLDVYPSDSNAINLREKYVKLYNQALTNYESKYGATELGSEYLSTSPWAWDSKKWPWEGNI